MEMVLEMPAMIVRLQPGTACDDGDACTTNDVYDAACNCAGTYADSDNDGVCDSEDNCPNTVIRSGG